MIETMSVSISGPALSLLIYENLKCDFGQEGFLLGQILEKKTSSITDNDQRQVHVSRTIEVNSCIPCPQTGYFYDGIGRVDFQKLRNFLGHLMPQVVAWYKYKPMPSFNLTYREKVVHKQLTNLFKMPSEYFTCCLLVSESSDNRSTHSFVQNFVRFNNHNYEKLPLHIANLSDPNRTYKTPERVSDSFNSILSGLKIDHKTQHGLTIVTKMQNALEKHTENVIQELSNAEERLFRLEKEVQEMKTAIRNKHMLDLPISIESESDYQNSEDSIIDNNSTTPNKLEGPTYKRDNSDSESEPPVLEQIAPILSNDDDTSITKSTRAKSATIRGRKREGATPNKRNNSDVKLQPVTPRPRKRN